MKWEQNVSLQSFSRNFISFSVTAVYMSRQFSWRFSSFKRGIFTCLHGQENLFLNINIRIPKCLFASFDRNPCSTGWHNKLYKMIPNFCSSFHWIWILRLQRFTTKPVLCRAEDKYQDFVPSNPVIYQLPYTTNSVYFI